MHNTYTHSGVAVPLLRQDLIMHTKPEALLIIYFVTLLWDKKLNKDN